MELRYLLTKSEMADIEETEKKLERAKKKIDDLKLKIDIVTELVTNLMHTSENGCTATTDRKSCKDCVFMEVCTHKDKIVEESK